jgi:hypothetical protein
MTNVTGSHPLTKYNRMSNHKVTVLGANFCANFADVSTVVHALQLCESCSLTENAGAADHPLLFRLLTTHFFSTLVTRRLINWAISYP